MVQILGYLQTPCTWGFPHQDGAIFGIFLISMNLHRHSEGARSDSYHFSLFDLPLIICVVPITVQNFLPFKQSVRPKLFSFPFPHFFSFRYALFIC